MAQELEFFDVGQRKNPAKARFKTSNYDIREKNGRFFAVAKSPSGNYECWKVLSKDKAAELKKG